MVKTCSCKHKRLNFLFAMQMQHAAHIIKQMAKLIQKSRQHELRYLAEEITLIVKRASPFGERSDEYAKVLMSIINSKALLRPGTDNPKITSRPTPEYMERCFKYLEYQWTVLANKKIKENAATTKRKAGKADGK